MPTLNNFNNSNVKSFNLSAKENNLNDGFSIMSLSAERYLVMIFGVKC